MVRFNHVRIINFKKCNCCKGSSFKTLTKKEKKEKEIEIDEIEKSEQRISVRFTVLPKI